MRQTITLAPVPDIAVFRTSAARPDDADHVRRRCRDGELLGIGRGLFVDAERWRALHDVERHLVRIHAVADRVPQGRVVSHLSAAAALGVPVLGALPERVHVIGRGQPRGTANATFVVHPDLDPPDRASVLTPDGIRTSSPTRTATDLVCSLPMLHGVVVLDDLLRRGVDRDSVRSALERRGQKGRRRAHRALDLADPSSGSVGESIARVRFDEYGTEPPVLQHVFRRAGEPDIVVDFWFPEAGVVVEFDGEVKCRDRTMLAGRSPHRALMDEKRREDRLRSFPGVRTVVRLTWAELWNEHAFRTALRRAGVRMRR